MEVTDRVIFFDGVCNLCNSSVSLLIGIDHKKALKYSPLQGGFAKTKLDKELVETADGVVFLSDGKVYLKSEAAVQILLQLSGFYKVIGRVLSVFPYRFLNIFYDVIAKYRYRVLGKSEECRLPTKEEEDLFIA